jgi:hypothetical protein
MGRRLRHRTDPSEYVCTGNAGISLMAISSRSVQVKKLDPTKEWEAYRVWFRGLRPVEPFDPRSVWQLRWMGAAQRAADSTRNIKAWADYNASKQG